LTALATASVLILSGCADERTAGVVPGAIGSSTTLAPTQEPPSVRGPSDEDSDLQTPAPYPTWDDASRAGAQRAARSGLARYAKPNLSAAAWWRGLRPRLSAAAAQAYTGTDPANIPVHAVKGSARLRSTPSAYLATVSVPTDVGTYRVLLSRAGHGEPWLIERFIPPASLGGS
jgi:hypothetical protein